MKRKTFFALLMITVFLLAGNFASAEGKLRIVTTNFPCYDLARAIAGDCAEIVMLLPPGSESHSFEPTPADMIAIQESDLFFYVGGESDTWVEGILDSCETPPRCLTMSECVEMLEEEHSTGMAPEVEEDGEEEAEEEAELDEHVWTSPVNMMAIAKRLCGVLCEISEENKEALESSRDSYLQELQKLDEAFRTVIAEGKRQKVIFGDRFPFLYFVREYGLDYDAAFPGCSDDAEPNVRTVITLIDEIREDQIPVVFYIELSSRKTADILCEETGAKALLFHSCHNISAEDFAAGESYLSLMTKNVQALKEALSE